MAASHSNGRAVPSAPVYVIDGAELHKQIAAMAATLVRTETLLASSLEAQREERQERKAERTADDARFAALERRVWAIPGAGTLIALVSVGLAVLGLKGG